VSERRTWDSPVRQPWNPIIHHLLKAVDTHNQLYFRTGDLWHLQKAREARLYVIELKDWIKKQE
jgi:exoribonuclease II